MAEVGSFGELVFKVSDKTVRTFDEMNWDFSSKYATHDRHIKADLLEYMGPEIETISFSMTFSLFLGVKPFEQIKKLKEMIKEGATERLVIGGKVYGDYKWVIQKGSTELQHFDKDGDILVAKVKVTLKEYPKR